MNDDLRYADVARQYFLAGWHGALPLPYREKRDPPKGWTGKGAPYPRREHIDQWCSARGRGGIGLRMPDTVLGIDVDAYDGKAGGDSFRQLIEQCGELPPTWTTTSRTDGSGIRMFAVPAAVTWSERLAGSGIELIRASHRYAIAWPSVHRDTGLQYRWIGPDGTDPARIPQVADLPELPSSWVRKLSEPPAAPRRLQVVHADQDRARTFAERQFDRIIDDLATLRPGMRRNDTLNRRAYYLGGLVGAGLLDETTVFEALYDAATVNGHEAKHGPVQTDRTIRSGLNAGMRHPIGGVAS